MNEAVTTILSNVRFFICNPDDTSEKARKDFLSEAQSPLLPSQHFISSWYVYKRERGYGYYRSFSKRGSKKLLEEVSIFSDTLLGFIMLSGSLMTFYKGL